MSKKIRKIGLVAILIVCMLFKVGMTETSAAPNKFSIYNTVKKNNKNNKNNNKKETTKATTQTTTKEETTQKVNIETTKEETTEVAITKEETTQKVNTETTKEETTEVATTDKEIVTEEEATTEAVTTEAVTTEEETTEAATKEATTKEETTKEETTEEKTTEKETTEETTEKVNVNNIRFQQVAEQEAKWLWEQQLSNGAFAVHNEYNGTVDINPYFSEIVAISLINYDSSQTAKSKIEKYFDWHISHINTAAQDYNGMAGTIYDYKVQVKNGVVVSETSKGVYDSTDSYSALFVKALGDYARVYGDVTYLKKNEAKIKEIVNVMFATMSSNGYTYAKPDYQIIYLMDNTEVYAGLCAAKYIYENAITDAKMLQKVTTAVEFYESNFNKHWWKGDHYASVLNPDYSEYTGYAFSWDMFYPCATAQMFPIMYGLAEPDSQYAKTLYTGLCGAWDWQDMDYVSEGVDAFCWGSFAYLGGLMNDTTRLNGYLNKYNEIVEAGRLYPLYSAESAMVLMGCNVMIK